MYLYFTQIFIYFSKPLRLLYSLIIYEIVNFSFFTLYSLLLLSFFLYLKSVPIYVIVHVYNYVHVGIICTQTRKYSHAVLGVVPRELAALILGTGKTELLLDIQVEWCLYNSQIQALSC